MTGPILLPIFARPEKCQSGRMGLTRNQVCPHGYRGFESLLLRRDPDSLVRVFSWSMKIVYQVHILLIVNMLCEELPQTDGLIRASGICFVP
jgi:hypothetical protein